MREIMDIHSHTYYSGCGIDKPETIVEAAIAGGIELFGISDHNYGIGDRLEAYREEMSEVRARYADKIRVLIGIELASLPGIAFHAPEKLKGFDYCLFEHLYCEESEVGMQVFEYRKAFPCKFGIAHTDLFRFAEQHQLDPLSFLRRFAENDIFWEMNVNYDSIHHFHEHQYCKDLLESPEQQAIVKASGIQLSVGFDGHRVGDYCPERVIAMNRFLYDNGFNVVDFG